MARSTARKRALNTLYEADEKSQDILSLLDERIAHPGAQTPLPDYAIEIVRGVAEHRRLIDSTLDGHSTGWKVRRMGVVDRNILRIAVWEILFNDEVPDKVAIDEALALAKTLCDDDSPAFIHGLLSAVCADKDSIVTDGKAADASDADTSDAEASDPEDAVSAGTDTTDGDAVAEETEADDSSGEHTNGDESVADEITDNPSDGNQPAVD
ncbi:nitrogen utilization protein B [Bifidobacterium myosotis]|uniref:Transcription antitermination protein NusB n=2 Tax=Bacteria TaxID=2 RepID=A0A261FJW9_9BIFI|nr:transcription antitermination factor NusB [Bifidobacterium myosotis]OZG59461.1 nitrogen utilization protein B [Bifidobacterium myosotis]